MQGQITKDDLRYILYAIEYTIARADLSETERNKYILLQEFFETFYDMLNKNENASMV